HLTFSSSQGIESRIPSSKFGSSSMITMLLMPVFLPCNVIFLVEKRDRQRDDGAAPLAVIYGDAFIGSEKRGKPVFYVADPIPALRLGGQAADRGRQPSAIVLDGHHERTSIAFAADRDPPVLPAV